MHLHLTEYLSQNLQFRKTLKIILNIIVCGSFKQDFEKFLFLLNISYGTVTAPETGAPTKGGVAGRAVYCFWSTEMTGALRESDLLETTSFSA